MILVCPRARAGEWEAGATMGADDREFFLGHGFLGDVRLIQSSPPLPEGPALKSSPGGSQLPPSEAPSRGGSLKGTACPESPWGKARQEGVSKDEPASSREKL